MNPLVDELATTMEWLRTSVENTAAPFLVEQTPLYIQELITFTIVWTSIKLGIWLLLLTIFLLSLTQIKKIVRATGSTDDIDWIMCTVLTAIIGAIIFAATSSTINIHEGVQAYFAPRVFIVEKLSSLL